MPYTLTCACGHRVEVTDEDARELVWCPKCRNILRQGSAYTASQSPSLVKGRPTAPAARKGGAGNARWAAPLIIGAAIAVARIATLSTRPTSPSYSYQPPPQIVLPNLDGPADPAGPGGALVFDRRLVMKALPADAAARETSDGTARVQGRLRDARGKVLQETNDEVSEQFAFRQALVSRPGPDSAPARLRREYERARRTQNGQAKDLAAQGQVVAVERAGQAYRFVSAKGVLLPAADCQRLNEDLFVHAKGPHRRALLWLARNGADVKDQAAFWEIDTAALARPLMRLGGVLFEPAPSSGFARLERTTWDPGKGRQEREVSASFQVPVERVRLADGRAVALQKGSTLQVTYRLTACLDGSAYSGRLKGEVSGTVTTVPTDADGLSATWTFEVSASFQETWEEIPSQD